MCTTTNSKLRNFLREEDKNVLCGDCIRHKLTNDCRTIVKIHGMRTTHSSKNKHEIRCGVAVFLNAKYSFGVCFGLRQRRKWSRKRRKHVLYYDMIRKLVLKKKKSFSACGYAFVACFVRCKRDLQPATVTVIITQSLSHTELLQMSIYVYIYEFELILM